MIWIFVAAVLLSLVSSAGSALSVTMYTREGVTLITIWKVFISWDLKRFPPHGKLVLQQMNLRRKSTRPLLLVKLSNKRKNWGQVRKIGVGTLSGDLKPSVLASHADFVKKTSRNMEISWCTLNKIIKSNQEKKLTKHSKRYPSSSWMAVSISATYVAGSLTLQPAS